jgi:hypothetical protein
MAARLPKPLDLFQIRSGRLILFQPEGSSKKNGRAAI